MSLNRTRSDGKERHQHDPFSAMLPSHDLPVVHRRKEYVQSICTSGDMYDVAKDGGALLNHGWIVPVNHDWAGGALGRKRL